MTKKISAVFVAICLVFAISGCSGQKSEDKKISGQKVGIVVPSSNPIASLDQETFLRWSFITDKIQENLSSKMESSDISVKNADAFDEQAKQITELVDSEKIKVLLNAAPQFSYSATKKEIADQGKTLLDSLNYARSKGVFVIGWGDAVNGFNYGGFVETPSYEEIGKREAEYLVDALKINIKGAKKKNIEVVMPDINDKVNREKFKGIWDYLKPYFQSGKLANPSGSLNKDSGYNAYKKIVTRKLSTGEITSTFSGILSKYYHMSSIPLVGSKGNVKIDGVLSSDDTLSNGIVKALEKNNVGKNFSEWPVITGFGAGKFAIEDIVNEKQSMTLMYDTIYLAEEVSGMIVGELEKTQKKSASPSEAAEHEDTTDMVTTYLQTVVQGNIMEMLVHPGYISPADAGR
jgi:ABC-type xylose transport system substrate-binding protein